MEIKNETLMVVTSDIISLIIENQISEYEAAIDSIMDDVKNKTTRSDIVSRKHLIINTMRSVKTKIAEEITDKSFLPSIAQSIKDREDYEHLVTPDDAQKGTGYDNSFIQ